MCGRLVPADAEGMSHLRLVDPDETPAVDDRPRVSLRLLMAASGRCSCDACLLAYRGGDKRAGILDVTSGSTARRLHAVR